MLTTIFIILTIAVVISDVVIAVLCFKRGHWTGRYLGCAMVCAIIVSLGYLGSIITTDYFLTSLSSSILFCSIDLMLIFMLIFVIRLTIFKLKTANFVLLSVLVTYAAFDVTQLLINPFHEISIHYQFNTEGMVPWTYQPMFLYQMHLGFSYVLIVVIILHLIIRSIGTPKAYRSKYMSILWGILFIVAVNAGFLFLPVKILDFSILFYSVIGLFIYWSSYHYSERGMLNHVRQMILNEVEQPIVLFDNEERLSAYNKNAAFLIPQNIFKNDYTLEEFIKDNDFSSDAGETHDDQHFQWSNGSGDTRSTYRCDLRVLKDDADKIIGKMFVLTENSLEYDLLTGFNYRNGFVRQFRKGIPDEQFPTAVLICDISEIQSINKSLGNEMGDTVIRRVSIAMQKYCPDGSCFARLGGTDLIAACPNTDRNQIRQIFNQIDQEVRNAVQMNDHGIDFGLYNAVSIADKDQPDVIKAMDIALMSIAEKKLLDGDASHSSLLEALSQTIKESDDHAELRIKRTQELGRLFGDRIGLTDIQFSDFGLLCLLHDVGMLAIPVEIITKPDQLNKAEIDLIRSHVEKGYRICKSAAEISGIADLVLYHHERWDGSGYPDGLSHENIPLLSRIMSIIDAYESMTSDSPHRKALPENIARAEIRRYAGTQFDPFIASEFLQMLDEIAPIDKKNEDDESGAVTLSSHYFMANAGQAQSNVSYLKYSKYILDAGMRIVEIDDNFEDLTGYNKDDIKRYNLKQVELVPIEDRDDYQNGMSQMLSLKHEAYLEHRILRKDGSNRSVFSYAVPYRNPETGEDGYTITVTDISATSAIQKMLEIERNSIKRGFDKQGDSLRRDSLTGLLNHEAFKADVEMTLLHSDRPVEMMIIDIDNFKHFNDTYGHQRGDEIIKITSHSFAEAIGDNGFVGRLGGDEFFAIHYLDPEDANDALSVEREAYRVAAKVFQYVTGILSSAQDEASISLGAAVSGPDTDSFTKLYKAADTALYYSKENGRNQYSLSD